MKRMIRKLEQIQRTLEHPEDLDVDGWYDILKQIDLLGLSVMHLLDTKETYVKYMPDVNPQGVVDQLNVINNDFFRLRRGPFNIYHELKDFPRYWDRSKFERWSSEALAIIKDVIEKIKKVDAELKIAEAYFEDIRKAIE